MSKAQHKQSAPAASPKLPETGTIEAQTRRLVEKSIARVNSLVAEVGGRNDAIADHVFETFYDGDVQKALNPNKDAPPGFTALMDETDGALHLGRTQLFHAVRVGALNRRLAKSSWSGLGWTVKIDLLRALGPDQSIDRVSEGASFAAKRKATVREVRTWVDEQLSAGEGVDEGGEPTPIGPTFLSARKAVELAATMGRADVRRGWVNRALKLQGDDRVSVRAAVKAAARNLEKLAQALDTAMEDA